MMSLCKYEYNHVNSKKKKKTGTENIWEGPEMNWKHYKSTYKLGGKKNKKHINTQRSLVIVIETSQAFTCVYKYKTP